MIYHKYDDIMDFVTNPDIRFVSKILNILYIVDCYLYVLMYFLQFLCENMKSLCIKIVVTIYNKLVFSYFCLKNLVTFHIM